MNWEALIGYIFSAITGIAGWKAGRWKRKNDSLVELQNSIDLLVQKNGQLLHELITMRSQNAELIANQETMKRQIDSLQQENAGLRKEVASLNSRLEGVKTITRKG